MTDREKFNFLYNLPDLIIIKGIDLLFEKYMDYNLVILNKSRKNNEYNVFRQETECTPKIVYHAVDDKSHKPRLAVMHYLGINKIYLINFNDNPYPEKMFDDYYNICIGLYRKETIDGILK
jgi:hypothetical protein